MDFLGQAGNSHLCLGIGPVRSSSSHRQPSPTVSRGTRSDQADVDRAWTLLRYEASRLHDEMRGSSGLLRIRARVKGRMA